MKLTVRSVKYCYQKIPENYIEILKKFGELTITKTDKIYDLFRYRIDVKDMTIEDLIKLSDDLGKNLVIEKDSYDKPCITIYDDCY